MYDTRQRSIALAYGVACHLGFALGIAAMVASLYTGMTLGRGPFTGATGWAFDLALLAQFALVHSFLLSARGRALLAHLAPAGIGGELRTTTFALIASLQLLLTFAAWSPSGTVWWEPHGALRAIVSITYGASWLFLLKAMADAGLPLQTGFLGWSAVVRGRAPQYRDFPARGTFRYMRPTDLPRLLADAVDRPGLDPGPSAHRHRVDAVLRPRRVAQGTSLSRLLRPALRALSIPRPLLVADAAEARPAPARPAERAVASRALVAG